MPSISQTAGQQTELAAGLALGVQTLSLDQELTFVKYIRLVLPIDGFVFWVRAPTNIPSSVLNGQHLDEAALNQFVRDPGPSTFTVKGSLHYSTDLRQEEAESSSNNRMIFTALSQVRDLNEAGPNTLYLATWEGVQFSFSSRMPYYQQAGLHHYVGMAVYQDMATQIDNPRTLIDPSQPVVSNSLPLWLTLGNLTPDWPFLPTPPRVPVYPSYLVPQNIDPPWIAVHIGDNDTTALQATPYLSANVSHYQLARDTVRLTFYGLRNQAAQDFMDAVNQYSVDTGLFGIMNTPILADVKRPQVELGALAQRKTAVFEVSYYQTAMRDLARQLILSATATFIPGDLVVPIIGD